MNLENINPRYFLAVSLTVLWLAATVTGFWFFKYGNIQPFLPEEAVFFDTAAMATELEGRLADAEAAAPTVIHFWDPACICSRFTTPHANDLMATYGARGVQFIVMVPRAELLAEAAQAFPRATDIRVVDGFTPPSSPAAALLAPDGQLAYFGPYSEGATCTVQDGAFVETVLDQLATGINPRRMNTLAVGCFCQWPDDAT